MNTPLTRLQELLAQAAIQDGKRLVWTLQCAAALAEALASDLHAIASGTTLSPACRSFEAAILRLEAVKAANSRAVLSHSRSETEATQASEDARCLLHEVLRDIVDGIYQIIRSINEEGV